MSSRTHIIQRSALWFNDGRRNRHTRLSPGDILIHNPQTQSLKIVRREVTLEWEQSDGSRLTEINVGELNPSDFATLVKVIAGIFGFGMEVVELAQQGELGYRLVE